LLGYLSFEISSRSSGNDSEFSLKFDLSDQLEKKTSDSKREAEGKSDKNCYRKSVFASVLTFALKIPVLDPGWVSTNFEFKTTSGRLQGPRTTQKGTTKVRG
jgi:hypothetical protein